MIKPNDVPQMHIEDIELETLRTQVAFMRLCIRNNAKLFAHMVKANGWLMTGDTMRRVQKQLEEDQWCMEWETTPEANSEERAA